MVLREYVYLVRALFGATTADGKSIFAGKEATGFSDTEEELMDAVDTIPFLPEDRIKSLGSNYMKASEPWQPKAGWRL
ncbi:hypothetical protein GYMLUDRAFT_245187 [Collybiopsis luxurians FD-317 M1]|uniref:Uncharacterized protein n=1 Tax=Collybiopsis luxurians FD-317 M1 TaxID=944289 RepID=A0A0D0BVH7_9AGAR|nr:hypothetical protein GYMLUDRAFT_245187 [Collybiopsis luxurians FD-317 M1]